MALHSPVTDAADAKLEAGVSVMDEPRFVKGYNVSMDRLISVLRKMDRSDSEIREEINRANQGETYGLERLLRRPESRPTMRWRSSI